MFKKVLSFALLVSSALIAGAQPPPWFGFQKPDRVTGGLIAFYQFRERNGTTVKDTSGVGKPLDLTLAKGSDARWSETGGLILGGGKSALWTAGPATKIINRLKATNRFTIEALITNDNDVQTGPARIVTISANPSVRNFTLGQNAHQFALRVRTNQTDAQGTPELSTGTKTALPMRQYVTVTFGDGVVQLYINSHLHISAKRPGNLSNWDPSYRLIIGNEGTLNRPWKGRVELVAIYDRALTPAEVKQNVEAVGDDMLLRALEQ